MSLSIAARRGWSALPIEHGRNSPPANQDQQRYSEADKKVHRHLPVPLGHSLRDNPPAVAPNSFVACHLRLITSREPPYAGVGARQENDRAPHEFGVKIGIRTQLSSTLKKCGVERQSDLVHLISNISTFPGIERSQEDTSGNHAPIGVGLDMHSGSLFPLAERTPRF